MITSTANQQVKLLIQLNKKAKLRNTKDVFVAEGPRMLQEAPGERIKKVYFSESYFTNRRGGKPLEGVPCEIVQDHIFKVMSDTQTPQGVLCLIRQFHYSLEDMTQKKNPLLLVLENIQDPGNLGTIMRTAEGAGADGVILSRDSVDMYNPKTIRATMGSVYRVPFLYADNLKTVLGFLKEKGIRSYAAHLEGSALYDREGYQGGTAFLVGNESSGLSQELADCADTCIRIPMEGRLESLNAAVASSLLMYEAYRQRR